MRVSRQARLLNRNFVAEVTHKSLNFFKPASIGVWRYNGAIDKDLQIHCASEARWHVRRRLCQRLSVTLVVNVDMTIMPSPFGRPNKGSDLALSCEFWALRSNEAQDVPANMLNAIPH